MSDYQAIFERREKKYITTRWQYEALLKDMEPYMERDAYGLHTICSLYFDTEDYMTIRPTEGNKVFKEKLRLRSYGTPKKTDNVYVEFKRKLDGVTYKRRVSMTYGEAMDYLCRDASPDTDGQIFREIDWYVKTYQPSPKALIAYDRIALAGRDDRRLRVTFDFNPRFRTANLDLSKGAFGTPMLGDNDVLLEIKTTSTVPCWLSDMMSEYGIFPSSFSKYKSVYETITAKEVLRYVG